MSKEGKLFFLSGEFAGSEVPLSPNSNLMMGRAKNCQMIFNSDRVSRMHCTVSFNPDTGKLMVINHSEQGIVVDNSQNVQKDRTIYLSSGSQMKLGHSNEIIQFICDQEKTGDTGTLENNKIEINSAPDDNVFSGCFVDSNEKTIAVLENSMGIRFSTGGGFSKNKAVLSDKRLYYNQRNGLISDTSLRACINIEDITGTEIIRRNPLMIPIWGIILLIISIIIAANVASSEIISFFVGSGTIILWGIIIFLIFCLTYIRRKGNYLVISHAGGCVKFRVVTYRTKEILDFQKKIHILMDINH